MIVVAKELLQYEEKYVNYYLNIPKLCYKEKNIVKNEMIEDINSLIFEDIITFMNMMEDSYNNSISKEYTLINSLTEFQLGYLSKDIISLAIEFSQLVGFSDISYIKVYNYDFKSKREIFLKDLFREDINYLEILKKHIMTQIKNFFDEIKGFEDEDYLNKNDIYLDEDNSFYFTHEFLILPFSSCEIDEEILNLIEFKIPFNKIYLYLNEYAIKNIVKKIIL